MDAKARFEDKFIKHKNGCWIWVASSADGRYGQFGWKRRTSAKAHRVSYELYVVDIPAGTAVCHTCDETLCVNPDHLWLGSQQDNLKDMVSKERNAKGEKHGIAKITEREAAEIFRSPLAAAALAECYGISRRSVSDIKLRKTWAHLNG